MNSFHADSGQCLDDRTLDRRSIHGCFHASLYNCHWGNFDAHVRSEKGSCKPTGALSAHMKIPRLQIYLQCCPLEVPTGETPGGAPRGLKARFVGVAEIVYEHPSGLAEGRL